MLDPKRVQINTYWENERDNAEVYRYVHFLSEPVSWIRLHRNGHFGRTLFGTGGGWQTITWVK